MDRVISDLAQYCQDLEFEALPGWVVRAAAERLVDTIGCAIGGIDCDAAQIARRLAPQIQPLPGRLGGSSDGVVAARAIGEDARTTTAEAAPR
jgi:2-methylcitrate dehydratase PrpD